MGKMKKKTAPYPFFPFPLFPLFPLFPFSAFPLSPFLHEDLKNEKTRLRIPFAVLSQRVTKTVYDIRRGTNYNNNNVPVVRNQLAKGGFRLAKLLDAIFENQ
jgi:hypothetical protein